LRKRPRPSGATVIVPDASILLVALADDGPDGIRARDALRAGRLIAPQLVDLEVASALRRRENAGKVDQARASLALEALQALPMQRVGHGFLIDRCWELRQNLTIYDAAYVAVAEATGARLITADSRLARSTGPRCPIETLA
jgi:predicted nucleic acid-binding protein